MSLRNADIQSTYFLNGPSPYFFYNELYLHATEITIALGYFAKTAFCIGTEALLVFIKNGGHMHIICNEKILPEDVAAISQGYELKAKEEITLKDLETLISDKNLHETHQFSYKCLSYLIGLGRLDIQVANSECLVHFKTGYARDQEGNIVAFSGSVNYTMSALLFNWEQLWTYCSWINPEVFAPRIKEIIEPIDELFQGKIAGLPLVSGSEIEAFIQSHYPVQDLSELEADAKRARGKVKIRLGKKQIKIVEDPKDAPFLEIPATYQPRPHQKKALENFTNNGFCSLFAMATGTGKTLTSLFAANDLCYDIDICSILILVPLSDLVEQWTKDVTKMYSGNLIQIGSKFPGWRMALDDYKISRVLDSSKRVIIISTYDSFTLNHSKILSCLDQSRTLIIALSGANRITSVTIPSSVTSIGSCAFSNCTSLTEITIPSGVTSIGSSAFNNCTGLTEITIPATVTTIGSSAFSNCTCAVIFEEGITEIPSNAFSTSKVSSVTIPSTVTSIGSSAFWGCSNLSELIIPSNVDSIGRSAFYGCSGLTEITIPSGVTSIESNVFQNCRRLAEITIPSSVTSIGANAFGGCYTLNTINYEGSQSQWNAIVKDESWNSDAHGMVVHCSDGDISIDSQLVEYSVGDRGPAGGLIFYDCDADNSEADPDGRDNLLSTVCGWRYLEAAPTIMYLSGGSYYDPKIGGTVSQYNQFFYGDTSQYGTQSLAGTSSAFGAGKENTDLIISKYGSSAIVGYVYNSDGTLSMQTNTYSKYAAYLCNKITYKSCSDWYLPSIRELEEIESVLFHSNSNPYPEGTYLSSTQCHEYDEGDWYGCYVEFFPDDPDYYDSEDYRCSKVSPFYVIPVRRFWY